MSRLRELRLQGFKTFADATRFVFEPGVNAVIGPNGSGKSNMADAVRWVLGEQSNRSLRTRRADDVIFTGSQQRKATGLAEVVLTLDNSDGWLPIEFGEVTVGRRAYRSGESEYLINGARARLRDIVELLGAGQLGANSLVVVGQGTVDAALSLRPEERRQLFEEAAGVKNLQVRKNEALARLSRAQENLTRVNDLLGELRPQVRRLALQAQHQQEHDSLRLRGRSLVLEAHRRREREIRSVLGDAHRRAAAAEAAADAIRAENASSREELAAAEAAYWEAEAAARRAAEERETTREAVIRLESRAEAVSARRAELAEAARQAAAELQRLDDASETNESDERVDAALAAVSAAELRWQEATEALAQADAALVAAEEALGEARTRDAERLAAAARRREEETELAARRERLQRELVVVQDERAGAQALIDERAASAGESTARAQAMRATLAEAERAADAAHARAAEQRQLATTMAERLAAIEASLDALADPADQRGGLGRRLAESGWRPLVDAVRAPDAAWPAIEAVVGGELAEALLWGDGDPASATADARGVARLLDGRNGPGDGERSQALAAVRATRTLADWIATSSAPSPAIFARVALAPDLAALMAGWRSLPAGWCAVTVEGDLADGRGMIALRGRADPPGGEGARRLARRGELTSEAARLRGEHEAATDRAARAVAEAAGLERRRSELRSQAAEAERIVRAAGDERQAALARRDRAAVDIARLEEQLGSLAEIPSQLVGDDGPHPEHASLESEASEARITRQAAATERDQARTAWQAARSAADELERAAAARQRARSERFARRAQLQATIDAAATAADAEGDDELLRGLAEAGDADEAANAHRRRADEEREVRRARLLELERAGSGAGARLHDAERALAASSIEVSRHEEALAAVGRERAMALDALEGDTDNGDVDGTPDGAAQISEDELAAEIAALDGDALLSEERRVRRTLAQIGSVNPFAVEEHREQSARLEEISGQEGDLQKAISSTLELIGTLDGEIGERFGAAFNAIGARFDEFVQLLFAGGSASLEMGESEDSEAGGIEIVVRPPGKRPQRLSMLSGGERALTGVALLFAMLSVNPVPFCILDEVDAALDEANIGRFAQALRRLSAEIDFVVITHNRATIEVADTIYGVTMTDAAVSRVLSLRLADVATDGALADAAAEVLA